MPKPNISTQQFLPFSAIYDDIVVSKKGQFAQVLMVNSVNFGLKSEEEQNAIIGQYQSFLNALAFPIEIVMHSKQLDLSAYIKDLQARIAQEPNELIRYQIQEYVDFVGKLISIANIMDKKFFIVVPYQVPATEQSQGGFFSGLLGNSHPHLKVPLSKFAKIKEELGQRINVVMSGLSSMGITSQVLSTKQLIELFYLTYNPEEAVREKLEGEIEAIGAGAQKAKDAVGTAQSNTINVDVTADQTSQTPPAVPTK
jgi:type IV secretory pathway VirB4 component